MSPRWLALQGGVTALVAVGLLGMQATPAAGQYTAASRTPDVHYVPTPQRVVDAMLTGIHELGHAYACKHFGGEVHEMGFMLLFFMPAFYANVNDAWSFPQRSYNTWACCSTNS